MSRRVAGKKALVTGAAQGLGEAIARMLAKEGAKVLLTDINREQVYSVTASINDEMGEQVAQACVLDVRDEASWNNAIVAAEKIMGGLSVLVNNAGIAPIGSIESVSLEKWHEAMAINVNGVFLGCRTALRLMRNHQPGSIVNISSIAGLIASHAFAAYNTSKAAVWMLTKSIALHCAHEGMDIRCNSVHPAFVDTPLLNGIAMGTPSEVKEKLARQIPSKLIGSPDDVAYAVIYAASDESRMMTGAELKLDGGVSAM